MGTVPSRQTHRQKKRLCSPTSTAHALYPPTAHACEEGRRGARVRRVGMCWQSGCVGAAVARVGKRVGVGVGDGTSLGWSEACIGAMTARSQRGTV